MTSFSDHKLLLDDLSFDTTDWEMHDQSDTHKRWLTPANDAVMLQYFNQPPTYPYDFTNVEAARAYYTEQAVRNGGAMVSATFTKAGGADVMKGIFKYRSPQPNSLAMYFVGVLAVPYRDFYFQINTESLEVGTTGNREAVVSLLRMTSHPEEYVEKRETIEVTDPDNMFEHMRSVPLRLIPADDEQYDNVFPNHPLSKVRVLQEGILRSLIVSPSLEQSASYRALA